MSVLTHIIKRKPVPLQYRVEGKDVLWVILFLLPFLLLYIGFTLWPLLATAIYSFLDWNGFKPITTESYVGFQNYLSIIKDSLFWKSFANTLIFATLNTVIKLPLSLFMAI